MQLTPSAIGKLLLIILGLSMFEIVSSLDNAIVNASILKKIKHAKARQFFVTWGMILAVGVVRGVLPFLIYFVPNSSLGLVGAMQAFWTGNATVVSSVQAAAPLLLMAGGLFLVLLFLHWLLVEEKKFCFFYEEALSKFGPAWFYSMAALMLVGTMVYLRNTMDPMKAVNYCLAAAVGVCAFFIADGFKEHAEAVEARLTGDGDELTVSAERAMSDWSKVFFLEVIDMTFSTDGVIGAFAFTMLVPVIMVGNGLGAYIVRRLTLGNVERLASYELLKNGAMYSIGLLGITMCAEGFGAEIPFWFSPIVTFACIGTFLWMSIADNRKTAAQKAVAA